MLTFDGRFVGCLHSQISVKMERRLSTLLSFYKNTEARFAQKIKTRLEHAQLQMRNYKKPIRILKFMNKRTEKSMQFMSSRNFPTLVSEMLPQNYVHKG